MNFCPYCGKQLDDNHAFCPYCGKQLKEQHDSARKTKTRTFEDYYAILGLPRSASEAEIRSAFRNIAEQCHPDVNGGNQASTEQFRKAAEAYEVLSDRNRRAAYDNYCTGSKPSIGASAGYSDYMDGVQEEAARTEAQIHSLFEQLKTSRKEEVKSCLIGLACLAAGLIITIGSMALAERNGGHFVVTFGLIACGIAGAVRSFRNAMALSSEIAEFKKTFWDSL